MKSYACVIVAASIVLYAICDCLKYKRNTVAVEEIVNFLSLVKGEIFYRKLPYPELISVGRAQNYQYISFDEDKINVDCNLSEIKENFSSFVNCLGTTDVQGQITLCEEYAEKFKDRLIRRKQKEESRIQINLSISVLCALSVVVVCI